MPIITSITPQVKDKTRCNIALDGRFFCGMDLATVMGAHLKAGMSVSAEQLASLQLESEKTTAFDRALTHISLSAKTEKEIRDFLKKKGYIEEVCDDVVEKMKRYGYLDDRAYSAAYAESAGKRKGKRLIAYELKRKGVSDEDIEEALSDLSEEGAAREVLQRYLRGKTPDRATYKKAFSYLVGKGFDYDTARSALLSLGDTDED